ncbi:MAG: protein kinase domain-containing protein, partial [Vicinamibacterales bacterium]
PEQAKGQATDHRSDIFSFGCVLFEMIAGRRTFEGENVSEILASVIKSEPDWAALPSDLHPRLIELLKRCLAKSRRDRYQAVGDVRFELTTIHRNPVAPAITATPAKRARWSWAIGLAAAALAGAAVASAIFLTRAAESSSAPIRFVVPLREGAVFTGPGRRTVGISPDGTAIVYAADQRLHVRRLGDLESRAITDKYEPNSPTYSPDGQWIAFYDNFSEEVKRVAAAGGVATTVAKIGRVPYDLAWSSNGLFYTSDPGVLRLREGNAQPELVAKADAGETFGSIDMIPGGPLLVSSVDQISRGDNPTTGFDRARVLAILPDGQRRVLWEGGTSARYLASGHLAFVRQGVLFAVGFDAKRLTMVGAPVPVVEGVGRAQAVGQFSVSSSGALVYIPGPSAGASGPWQLAIFSSTQPEGAPLKVPPASYVQARVSPNGKTVALSMDNDR